MSAPRSGEAHDPPGPTSCDHLVAKGIG